MLTRFKKLSNASSSAGIESKKGNKSRLELSAHQGPEAGTFHITLREVGGYGKLRYECNFGTLSREDLLAVAGSLQALANGQVTTTALSEDQINANIAEIEAAAAAAEPAPAPEATPAAEPQAEAAASDDASGIEQLSAD